MKTHGPQTLARDAVAVPSRAAAACAAPGTTVRPVPSAIARPDDPLNGWNGWASLSEYAEPEVDAEGYIYADGRSLTPGHAIQMTHAFSVLRDHFGTRGVFVHMDTHLHYRRGDRTAFLQPDLMVVFGLDEDLGINSHRVWERGVPSLVLELLSESSRGYDLDLKVRLYERIGAAECVLYDWQGKWLPERLRMFGLVDGAYVERTLSTPVQVVDYDGTMRAMAQVFRSEALRLDFLDLAGNLRLRDPATRRLLPTTLENLARAEHERQRAERAQQRAEHERQRAHRERQGAERARRRADRARQGAERERRLAAAAEARVAELEKLLRERHPDDEMVPSS